MNKTLLFRKFIFCLLPAFFFNITSLLAQDCTNRYFMDVFSNVTAHTGITFGFNSVNNYAASTTTEVELKMNIFEPVGDTYAARPLIILAFGGSFVNGDRNQLTTIAESLAKKGYVVASIDYRLADNNPSNLFLVGTTPELAKDVVVKSIADMRAAIRYLKHNAGTYKIDKNKIILGGVSAGAIVALQTAFIDNVNDDPGLTTALNDNAGLEGGLEGNTDLPTPLIGVENSQGILGVLNVSGAVFNTDIIDAGEPVIFSSHGEDDEIVPYSTGTFNGLLAMFGSSKIEEKADAVNIENELYTVDEGNHESTMVGLHLTAGLGQALLFFQPMVCIPTVLPVKVLSFSGNIDSKNCNATIKWSVAEEDNLSYTLQQSINGNDFKDVADIKVKNVPGNNTYYQTLPLEEGNNYYRLKINYASNVEYYKYLVNLSGKCGLLDLSLYPNPAKNYVQISGMQSGKKNISVKMIDGREVFSITSTSNTERIDTSNLTKGLYFVSVSTNANTEVKRLIIN